MLQKDYIALFLWFFTLFSKTSLVLSKGGGAGAGTNSGYSGSSSTTSMTRSSSGSGWVFFYYGVGGEKHCGNYCITVFSILAFLILLVIICGIWKCYEISKEYKKENSFDIEASLFYDDKERNNNSPSINSIYPSLSDIYGDKILPPSYKEVSPAPEKSFFYGLKNESKHRSYIAGEKFSKKYPPIEEEPSSEHIQHIKKLGVKAWKIRPDKEVIDAKIVTICNDGLIVEFKKKSLEVIVQANYPMFDPFGSFLNKEKNNELSVNTDSTQSSYNKEFINDTTTPVSNQITENFSFFYYEIKILSNPNKKKTAIAMGLATRPYPNFRFYFYFC
ncbi:hypothetical protein [endosymbiont GvMRE of Glomus versiforme]|uniref:hypothetical protein n=1 Tax=endosymbiont GvMRE of Glomus versiforme TaxID=2039283 RepID=UPI0011C3CFD8|nr:hypothetical protein [endosymbiont GvMRE of Glomus versiforme]